MADNAKFEINNLSYYYQGAQVLRDLNLNIPRNAITVIFGPAGGGKTTLLRLLNRLNDLVHNTRISGEILLDGIDVGRYLHDIIIAS